jgi:hypothetical protein
MTGFEPATPCLQSRPRYISDQGRKGKTPGRRLSGCDTVTPRLPHPPGFPLSDDESLTAAYAAIFLLATLARFVRKDVTS